jgi:predicted nucleic acid-binding protein
VSFGLRRTVARPAEQAGVVLIVDTNVWLAAAYRRSERHGDCAEILRGHVGEPASPVPVIAETSQLILDRLGAAAQNEFLRMIVSRRLEPIELHVAGQRE